MQVLLEQSTLVVCDDAMLGSFQVIAAREILLLSIGIRIFSIGCSRRVDASKTSLSEYYAKGRSDYAALLV